MARNLQIVYVGCLTAAMLLISGCSSSLDSGLQHPYSYENSVVLEKISAEIPESGKADSFAKNLCVLTGKEFDTSDVSSEAAAIFDLHDKQVLYGKNIFQKMYPASMTKVMTALLAVKYGNLDDVVTVTEEAIIRENGATLCGIKPGDQLTLEQLLYGLLLPSGNDAGAAIAVHMSGSIEKFAEWMNQEAYALGATHTHFMNPHGLSDSQHYTTAYDLYLIFNEAMKYEMFRKIDSSTTYIANYTDYTGTAISKTWQGGNWYMIGERKAPEGIRVISGKTGTTSAAGYCLIMMSSDEKQQEYISVVMKAANRPNLYDNMSNILAKIVD